VDSLVHAQLTTRYGFTVAVVVHTNTVIKKRENFQHERITENNERVHVCMLCPKSVKREPKELKVCECCWKPNAKFGPKMIIMMAEQTRVTKTRKGPTESDEQPTDGF